MVYRSVLGLLALLLAALPAAGQGVAPAANGFYQGMSAPPQTYAVLGVEVEGVEEPATRDFVRQQSGLAVGQQVQLPGDPAFGEAIRAIYRLGTFSDVEIMVDRRTAEGVYLTVEVAEVPRLNDYTFEGVKKKHRDDLQERIPLIKRTPVRPADIERSRGQIAAFYEEKGYPLVTVEARRIERGDGTVDVRFDVNRGAKVEVEDIRIHGNEVFSDGRLIGKMKETKEDRWWRFWAGETFDEDAYYDDLTEIVRYYNNKGYYDAHIVSDSFYVETEGGEPELFIDVTVHEGPQYHIRDIEWEGNTVYPEEVLTETLGLEPGDVYDAGALESSLYGSPRGTDVSSLYMNRGYMKFNVQPRIEVVAGDSLDITFDLYEGETYEFGTISIAGNTKTKEHVIRRELYTVPGQTFSRDALTESIRRLQQLNYFAQESLAQGPSVELNEEMKTVDLTYQLEEVGGDQLELSGTWGRFGLVLMTRFSFNNFSAQNLFNPEAWRPLPAGDGQKLSLAVQTNGRYYQNYSLSFTEPWFRGRPQPIGFGLSYTRIGEVPGRSSYYLGNYSSGSARAFYERRLKWPDDKFSTSSQLRYQFYNIGDRQLGSLPEGISQTVAFQQSLSRSSLDNPLFPMSGTSMNLSVEVAPPVGGFVQYHKWRFKTQWNVPLTEKLSFGVGTDYGYIGTLTGDDVEFERFVVGGSPFDTQGLNSFFGKDLVYMRGYPAGVIGGLDTRSSNNNAVGGRVLNKYASELRWMAVSSPQFRASPYLFLDAANTWNDFGSYNPSQLFRSAGLGARLFLPMLGMIELTYGYNFDEFEGLRNDGLEEQRWYFQFSIGQGFGL